MIQITICTGGSCHMQGSYDVVNRLEELVVRHGLMQQVSLKASPCLGRCGDGVCVRIEGDTLTHVDGDNIEDIFTKRILPHVLSIQNL